MFEAGVNAAKHMPGRLKCIVPEVKNLGCPATGSRIPEVIILKHEVGRY